MPAGIEMARLRIGVKSQFNSEFGSLVNKAEWNHWKFKEANIHKLEALIPKMRVYQLPAFDLRAHIIVQEK